MVLGRADAGGGALVIAAVVVIAAMASAPAPWLVQAQQAPPTERIAPAARPVDPRTARLAEQRKALELELAAMEQFGQQEPFLAALTTLAQRPTDWTGDNVDYLRVADGSLPRPTIEGFVAWHTPAAGRSLPAYADAELPGHPLPVIVDFAAQLRTHGVDLLVVAIPARIEMEPELVLPLPSLEGFAGMGGGTVRLLLALNAAGIDTIDLRPPLAGLRGPSGSAGIYLRTDPHWTPAAVEAGARAVAEAVARFDGIKVGSLREARDFVVEQKKIVIGGDSDPALSRDAKDERLVATTLRDPFGGRFECADPTSSLLLLGDSFVTIHRPHGCDFGTHLARFVGRRFDIVAPSSGAILATRQALSRRDPAQWTNRRLVVWCLAGACFAPRDQWKKVAIFGE